MSKPAGYVTLFEAALFAVRRGNGAMGRSGGFTVPEYCEVLRRVLPLAFGELAADDAHFPDSLRAWGWPVHPAPESKMRLLPAEAWQPWPTTETYQLDERMEIVLMHGGDRILPLLLPSDAKAFARRIAAPIEHRLRDYKAIATESHPPSDIEVRPVYSKTALVVFLRLRMATWPANSRPATLPADRQAAELHFGCDIGRDVVRAARREAASIAKRPDWVQRGPRK